mmetsp:Transcript_12045/g.14611  ORF Transcript_12045/g.14611 Transcript_12045/m.14611 type:complete len:703 (-) Transcript_12045:490-2598(-)|eukprot:CAMPEP_0184014102 /NCGR_PEP_ID=MMETSP0954-20121128/5437_1 /TAXON_ID=627963 /ORGANISM="Aplanochytrium sp, Strain PBS07" /LENGTH=702 /DNA_ID=CAMNT_0026294475 /DNA_START=101 /DNA_END=2209 /DNA_ORIENTATION=+
MAVAVEYREISLDICRGSLTLKGRAWGPENVESKKRILAWPGWLDNCGSWNTIAPYFAEKGYLFVGLDPPGCGFSDHRPACSWYADYDECILIIQAADQLGWDEPFTICGHSRGSNISGVTAAVFSNRIRAAIVIEGMLGISGCYTTSYEEVGAPFCQFSNLIKLDRVNRERVPRVFDCLEDVIEHNRTNKFFPKARATAEGIALRHIKQLSDGKYQFVHDTRTYGQMQPHYMFPPSNIAIRSETACPVLCINARNSAIAVRGDYETFLRRLKSRSGDVEFTFENSRPFFDDLNATIDAISDLTLEVVPGGHHVHSDDPATVAPIALKFLQEKVLEFEYVAEKPKAIRELEIDCHDYLYLLPDIQPDNIAEKVRSNKKLHEDFSLDVLGQTVCVKRWGSNEAKHKVLAWCDDQDNAASFDRLGELVATKYSDICLIAVDRPGRGFSDHLSLEQFYDVGCEAPLLLDIADAFHWNDPFTIILHDRAAAAGIMVAGNLPERINGLIFLDYNQAVSLPEYMHRSEMYYCYENDKEISMQLPEFSSFKEAEEYVRTKAERFRSPLALSSIVSRCIKQTNSGTWIYTDDPRLKNKCSPHRPSFETVKRAMTRIRTPVLFLNSENDQKKAVRKEKPLQASRCLEEKALLTNTRSTSISIESSHYMHIDNAEDCLRTILAWARTNKVWDVEMNSAIASTKQENGVQSKL